MSGFSRVVGSGVSQQAPVIPVPTGGIEAQVDPSLAGGGPMQPIHLSDYLSEIKLLTLSLLNTKDSLEPLRPDPTSPDDVALGNLVNAVDEKLEEAFSQYEAEIMSLMQSMGLDNG